MDNNVGKAAKVIEQVNKVILGKDRKVKEIMTAFLAGGHILLEDIPGVGKTTLATAASKAIRLDCRRVQFTPDVMPSDLTGYSVYRSDLGQFVYQPGSVFCNLLLADEINRTSPKTQSALLEVMEERKVSVEGITRDVPDPFIVIATQNPYGNAGTQSLPEAQMDRFMITMSIGYPDFESEMDMAMSIGKTGRTDMVEPVITAEDVYMNKSIYKYIIELVTATRESEYIERGASQRATIALVKMSKAWAWLNGRDYVIPSDVGTQFEYVISHRIVPDMSARMEKLSKSDIINNIVKSVKRPVVGEKGVN